MKKTFNISGITCKSCKDFIEEKTFELPDIQSVKVCLEKKNITISSPKIIDRKQLQNILGSKYLISEVNNFKIKSKIIQLKPLVLIFMYLIFLTLFINFNDFKIQMAMIDFMGLFFLTFSLFKLIDYSSFPQSFSNYDPLAMKFPFYAKTYPFIELILGVCFLFRFEVQITSLITFFILSITTYGIIKTLINKKEIQCACLGTSLKLPMTEATLIENIIMISMALTFLI